MVDDFEFAKLRERVSLLERQVVFLLGQSNVSYVDRPATLPYPDVAEFKRKGNLIEAIKLYRNYTGATLMQAKIFVENMEV
jgi:hypothetical protein